MLQPFRGSLCEPEVSPTPSAQVPGWDMGQQRSHLELGTTGRSWPLHGHGRGSVLYGLPREEQCLASACDGSGNTRLEDGLLYIRNTSSVWAGWWVSNPEAFSAVEKKKKNQNQPPNTQSYVGSCSMDLPVKIPLLQLFLSVAPPPSHTSGIIPKGHCTGTLLHPIHALLGYMGTSHLLPAVPQKEIKALA